MHDLIEKFSKMSDWYPPSHLPPSYNNGHGEMEWGKSLRTSYPCIGHPDPNKPLDEYP